MDEVDDSIDPFILIQPKTRTSLAMKLDDTYSSKKVKKDTSHIKDGVFQLFSN